MDVWHSADPQRVDKTGWLARAGGALVGNDGGILGIQVGPGKLPLAMTGASGMISLGDPSSFELTLTGPPARQSSRKKLIEDLSKPNDPNADELSAFVQRRQLQTLKVAEKIQDALKVPPGQVVTAFNPGAANEPLGQKLQVIARLIQKGPGTRLFYVAIDGFDTHSNQNEVHGNLLNEIASGVEFFFNSLGDDKKRVLLMTYSEFGRRVKENGSKGTDHGAASCLFVAGPSVKAGPIGKHPNLGDLDDGDLKFGLDFRRLYATLLDKWLGCDSQRVLGAKFEHVELLTRNG
jgi:uncharacterized protein (DUF1501 family)